MKTAPFTGDPPDRLSPLLAVRDAELQPSRQPERKYDCAAKLLAVFVVDTDDKNLTTPLK